MNRFSKPYDENEEFKRSIAPFEWVESDECEEPDELFSLCLPPYVDAYNRELFATRADEGFKGSGEDWASLASVFLEEKAPELKNAIEFGSQMDMFTVYSSDADALASFAVAFKDLCDDDAAIRDLFSRAGTDHILDEKIVEERYGEDMAAAFRQTREMKIDAIERMKEAGGLELLGEAVFEEIKKSEDVTSLLFRHLHLMEGNNTNKEK